MNEKTPFENDLNKPEIEKDTGNKSEREVGKVSNDIPQIGEKSFWSRDQQERNYYYDDDHGYEKYDPENDSADED